MFTCVLVANRGEIAVRVIRTLHRMGIRAAAVYSDADAAAPHVDRADAAVRLGPAPAADSYLRVEALVAAAAATGAQAVHPGYGFLSENAGFARAVVAAGLVWIGPPPEAIAAMGDKIRAKRVAREAGVPVVPGVAETDLGGRSLAAAAAELGYPLLVKAAAGGGGRGMRTVHDAGDLQAAVDSARREAETAFGDGTLLLERLIEHPRHLEIQVLADRHGTVLHLGERECSLQRRHQKVIEEAPSPLLTAGQRQSMGGAAVALAAAVGYEGAGTVEFIVGGDDPDGFAFLEMNTRLQVEHPVTEEVYGLDLVEQQLRVAAGERLAFAQADLAPAGWAVEARIYAEDPATGFLPTGGRVRALAWPGGPGVRVDAGIVAGSEVGSFYDPLLAKVITVGADRAEALRRLERALADTAVLGVTTNTALCRALVAAPDVRAGRLDTGLIARAMPELGELPESVAVFVVAALLDRLAREPAPGAPVDPFDVPSGWRLTGPGLEQVRVAWGDQLHIVSVRGRAADASVSVGAARWQPAGLAWEGPDRVVLRLGAAVSRWYVARDGQDIWVGRGGAVWPLRLLPALATRKAAVAGALAGPLRAPLPGTVVLVAVGLGQAVTAGQTILVVEAMKTEHPIVAPADGTVVRLLVSTGQQVPLGADLAEIRPATDPSAQ